MSAALVVLIVQFSPAPAGAEDADVGFVVQQIRVHGNHRRPDDEVIAAAGIVAGDRLDASGLAAVESRLRAADDFAEVELRVRHLSLHSDGPAVLIIVVQERPPTRDRLQFSPLLDYTEDFGFAAGARIAGDDVLGLGEHAEAEATIGGVRALAVRAQRRFAAKWIERLDLAASVSRREHPSFESDLDRVELAARAARPLGPLELGLGLGWLDTDLADQERRFVEIGADLTVDTRDSINYPSDAVYARAGLVHVAVGDDLPSFYRVDLEGRVYKRLVGRSVVAAAARLELVDHALPLAVRPYLGGAETLRGHSAGSFIGDQRLQTSVEVRVPLSSQLSFSRWGVHGFYDSGQVWNHGTSRADARHHHGLGVGAFAQVAFLRGRVDVAHDLRGSARLHFSTAIRF